MASEFLKIIKHDFKVNTVAAHLGAVAFMETQHFFSKGHSTYFYVLRKSQKAKCTEQLLSAQLQ